MTRLRLRVCAALLLALAAPCAARAAAAASCPTTTYVAGLQRVQALLEATPPDSADAVRQIDTLQRADAPYPPVLAPIRDDLVVQPPNLADARARIGALTAALAIPRGATCSVDSSAAQQALHDVYSDRVFAGLDATAQPSLLSVVLGFISSLLSSALGHLGLGGSLVVGIAVLLAVAAYAVLRARRTRAGRAARGVRDEPAAVESGARGEWAAADAAAQRGAYREAVRHAFRSALLEVVTRGGIRFDAAWTTRELLAATAADGRVLALLAPAAAAFDLAWYSGRPVGRANWERAREQCAALREMARRGVPQRSG